MGKRNENVHRLAENLVPFVLGHEFYGAAVVQTVSKLYQHNTYIIIESQEDTFEILGLEAFGIGVILGLLVLVVENVLDLRKSFYQRGYLVPEDMADIVHGIIRVLHHIMQQGSRYRLVAQAYIIDDNLGDSDRMQYIWLA